jgi:hypothetical protein
MHRPFWPKRLMLAAGSRQGTVYCGGPACFGWIDLPAVDPILVHEEETHERYRAKQAGRNRVVYAGVVEPAVTVKAAANGANRSARKTATPTA